MTPAELDDLRAAVTAMHGCECQHAGTAMVKEMLGSTEIVWQGEVETFNLKGHERAKRAFAWSYVDDAGETQYVAVLEIPPIVSPRHAVQAAIASGRQI